MANVIRHKRGTSDPVAGDFTNTGELLINTTDGGLFTKTDSNSVVEIGAGGGGTSSLKTAVYRGPASVTTGDADSTAYTSVNVATAVGTPDSIYSNSNGVITLGEAGQYLVLCTVCLFGNSGNYRWTGELQLRQNTGSGLTEVSPTVQGGYIRVSSGSQRTFISLERIVTTADANDTIDFQLRRTSSVSSNGQFIQNSSTIQIIKLDGVSGPTGPQGPTDVPQNAQTSAYTLVASDNGKHVSITTGGVTVPGSVFSAGNIITIYNNSGSNQTITQGSSVTLREAGTANTGNRTLAQRGLATILCVASNEFVITGTIS